MSTESAGMFTRLLPLLAGGRQLHLILIGVPEADLEIPGHPEISVDVIPKLLDEKENPAIATPLSLRGSPEDLDAAFAEALTTFVAAKQTISEQIAEFAKVSEQEAAALKAATATKQTAAAKARTGKGGATTATMSSAPSTTTATALPSPETRAALDAAAAPGGETPDPDCPAPAPPDVGDLFDLA